MDPYLEGYLWPDVHNALANKIRQQLTPLLRPRYTARLGIYVVEDSAPESDLGIMYPDIEVMRNETARSEPPARASATSSTTAMSAVTPATLSIPIILPIDVQLTNVEIHDTASNRLVTSIEIVSPVNKRDPGLLQYRLKRQRLYQAGIHLIEIDLIRRGTRPVAHPQLPDAPYLVGLTRAHQGKTDVWPLTLRDPLPTIPIPLRPPDDDVTLNLAAALVAVYDEAAYDLSINYQQDPPPPNLSADDRDWVSALVRSE
jgi:hypothetical protein